MTAPHEDTQLMSMREIAELAGVQRPVVTNWRRRYDSFPHPVAGDQARPLFDGKEIAALADRDWTRQGPRHRR